jgi:hypothetical protein
MKRNTLDRTSGNRKGDEKHKSFSLRAKHGIKGESFFESLIVEYSLPNHIVGSKDIGLDYICEWVHGDNPTGILFGVQIKSFTITPSRTPKLVKQCSDNNKLDEYRIKNSLFVINKGTLKYWKELGIPIYLFAVSINKTNQLDCYYKRFTPILTQDTLDIDNPDFYSEFYKANDSNEFLAFQNLEDKTGGFARDLFIDYIRCNYNKGIIVYPSPRSIGLNEFPEKDAVFGELVNEYRDKIMSTYNIIKDLLEKAPSLLSFIDSKNSSLYSMSSYSSYATLSPSPQKSDEE